MANHWDWNQFFKQAAATTFIIGAGYLGHRVQEDEIDRLLALPLEQGLRVIVESVPAMDNNTWLDFQRRLGNRTRDNQNAMALLEMAQLMVRSENEIQDIVNRYSLIEAYQIIGGVLQTKNRLQQFAMIAYLNHLGKSDARAKAILGYLLA